MASPSSIQLHQEVSGRLRCARSRSLQPSGLRDASQKGSVGCCHPSRPGNPPGRSGALGLPADCSCIVATATMAWAGPAFGHAQIADALALCYPTSGNVKNVSSSSALEDALSSASPGDHIVVAPGTYSGNFTLKPQRHCIRSHRHQSPQAPPTDRV